MLYQRASKFELSIFYKSSSFSEVYLPSLHIITLPIVNKISHYVDIRNYIIMRTHDHNYSSSTMQDKIRRKPQPGEIWELSRTLKTPQDFSVEEFNQLYSQEARRFLQGESATRYVIIVTEPESPVELEEWQVISVMVLSEKTNFISDVDLLIPPNVSGLAQEILVETWHIESMLVCNLLQPVGKRLSYEI